MIIFSDNYEVVASGLKAAVEAFAKKHKSDTPIHVTGIRPDSVHFMDLRVPTKIPVATLEAGREYGNEKLSYKVTSDRIKNAIYSPQSAGYRTRKTTSVPILQKMLTRCVLPYEPYEIAKMTSDKVRSAHMLWKLEPQKALQLDVNYAGGMKTLMEEVRNLVAQGATFITEPFKGLAATGVDLYEQKLFRESLSDKYTMAFFNPDGRVVVVHPKLGSDTVAGVGDLPGHMQQNIALLRLAESEKFIPEVGYRANEQTFWVVS